MTTNREQGEKLLKEAQWIFERISKWLAEARAPSFYGERDFTKEDSSRVYNDAAFCTERNRNPNKIDRKMNPTTESNCEFIHQICSTTMKPTD